MALRLNLYHEVIRAKRQRQYDPFKLSLLGLIIVAVGLASYYFIQFKRTSDARAVYTAQKAEFDRLTPQQKEAEKKEGEMNKQIELAEKFAKRIEKRIYWAPVFEHILSVVPANVQLTKLTCDSGREKAGLSTMSIEGIAADQEPRAVAEDLRKAVVARLAAKYPNAAATFRNLDESSEKMNVNGKRVTAAVFTIAVTFRTENEPPPAAPAQSKRVPKNEASAL